MKSFCRNGYSDASVFLCSARNGVSWGKRVRILQERSDGWVCITFCSIQIFILMRGGTHFTLALGPPSLRSGLPRANREMGTKIKPCPDICTDIFHKISRTHT